MTGIGAGVVAEHGGGDVEVVGDDLAAADDGALVEVLLDAPQVAGVHDAGVVGAGAGVGAVELADGGDQCVGERLADAAVDEHVVGGDARLPGVEELPPRDPPCCGGHVGVGGHDGGRLPTELEGDGSEVPGSRLHHHPGHASVAGVEDVVEALL